MKNPKIIFISLLLASCLFTYYVYTDISKQQEERVQIVLNLYAERIRNAFNDFIYITNIFRNLVLAYNGALPKEVFQAAAGAVYNENYFISINYMPNGIITDMFPPQLQELFRGENVFISENTSSDAYIAKKNQATTLAGPYQLSALNNTLAIAVRTPVFLEKNDTTFFWGFITSLLHPQTILKRLVEINELEKLGYEISLQSYDYTKKPLRLFQTTDFSEKKAHVKIIEIGKDEWKFFVYRSEDKTILYKNTLTVFLICMTFSFIIYCLLKNITLRYTRVREQVYKDPLTKLYNRKIIEEYMQPEWKSYKDTFTVFYLDLNNFKPVNDTYGHDMGDKLLIAFAGRMKAIFKEGTILARIGGDEFVAVVNDLPSENAVDSILKRITDIAERKFHLDNVEINISTSIGYAMYPKDGAVMKDILESADKKMYADKQKRKAERRTG